MAENDNTGVPGAGNGDLRVESATLLFELRIALEAAVAGIKRIITRQVAAPVQAELGILLRLMEQGCEALVALDDVLERFLKRRTEEGTVNG